MIEAPEAPHHHHHKTGLPWFDLIVPVAVLCISVASLLTSLQSEKSMHALVEQNSRLVSAQSTPLLMLDTANYENGKSLLSMTISNVGTGPAQIAWFRVVDAEGHDFSAGAIEAQASKLDEGVHFVSQQIAATFLLSGTSVLFFDGQNLLINPLRLPSGRRTMRGAFIFMRVLAIAPYSTSARSLSSVEVDRSR